MPWRMIGMLVLLGLVAGFATLNLEHRSDISFGFYEFSQIPVFLSLLVAFILGAVLMLPFTLGRRRRKKKAEASPVKPDRKGKRRDKLAQEALPPPEVSQAPELQRVANKPRGLGALLGGKKR